MNVLALFVLILSVFWLVIAGFSLPSAAVGLMTILFCGLVEPGPCARWSGAKCRCPAKDADFGWLFSVSSGRLCWPTSRWRDHSSAGKCPCNLWL